MPGRARENHVYLSPNRLCKQQACRGQRQDALRARALGYPAPS